MSNSIGDLIKAVRPGLVAVKKTRKDGHSATYWIDPDKKKKTDKVKHLSTDDIMELQDKGIRNIYVRWSRGPEYDNKPSRDYASGGEHQGLSAVWIDYWDKPTMERRLKEYEFLRMKDPELRPYIYQADEIGKDSDGYSSIPVGSKVLGVWSDWAMKKSLTFSGWPLQGRKKIHGMDISIENRKGSVRRGVDKDGHEWKTKMQADYGYIRQTIGKDKDHLDCYIGPNPDSRRVFIIHQNDPVTGSYDEDKCLLGFNTPEEAKSLYMKQYDRPGFFGEMDETDIDTFKEHALDKKNHGKKLVIRRSKNPELEVGIKVEMEHTDDPEEAKKIALDHLKENKHYYSRLIASGLVDEKEALEEAKRQGLKKSREWTQHKYIKKVGNKYFYTEDEIRNFRLQKRSDGFYYMDETKITNDPEKARQFEEKVREYKSAERGVMPGDKVQIKPNFRGSVGRGIVGHVKELGDGFARIVDEMGRMFRVPTEALVFARSIQGDDAVMIKSDNGSDNPKLVTKVVMVTRKGTTFPARVHVKPEEETSTKKRYVVRIKKPTEAPKKEKSEVDILAYGIDNRETEKFGIDFCKVPPALEKHGIPGDVNMKIRSFKLSEVMDEKHGITKEQLLAVQEAFKDPLAVIGSTKKADNLIVYTDVLDNEGRPIMAAIIPGGDLYGRKMNVITSIYGRNNFENHLQDAIDNKMDIFVNQEKLEKLRDKLSSIRTVRKSVRYVVAVMEKARKSPKLVPEKRMVTRDGHTFQTTVWVLPGEEKGPVQGGFDFDAEPPRNVSEDLDGKLEIAFKQANPKTKEGYFKALAAQLGGDSELQAEFAKRFNINSSLPGAERKAHIIEQISGEFRKQKANYKARAQAYRQSKEDEKNSKVKNAMAGIERMAMDAEADMQEQIDAQDENMVEKTWLPVSISDADYLAYKELSAIKKAELSKNAFEDGSFDESFKRVSSFAEDSLVGQHGKKDFKAGWSSIKSAVKWFIENRLDDMAKESQSGIVFQKPFVMKYGGYQAMQSARYSSMGKGHGQSKLENTGVDLDGEVWSSNVNHVTWDSPIGRVFIEKGTYSSDPVKIGISVSESGNATIAYAKKMGVI